jgi:hypothetical protein
LVYWRNWVATCPLVASARDDRYVNLDALPVDELMGNTCRCGVMREHHIKLRDTYVDRKFLADGGTTNLKYFFQLDVLPIHEVSE